MSDILPAPTVITRPAEIIDMIRVSEQGGVNLRIGYPDLHWLAPRMLGLKFRYVLDMEIFCPLDKFLRRAVILHFE